jgi:hypothetical protein
MTRAVRRLLEIMITIRPFNSRMQVMLQGEKRMRSTALALLLLSTAVSSQAQVISGLGGEIDTMDPTPQPLPPKGGVQDEIKRNAATSMRRFDHFYTLNSGVASNVTLVPDPENGRRKVFHMQLRNTDPDSANGKRTEIAPTYEYTHQGVRWYASSVYFPADWVTENEPERPVVVFQLNSGKAAFAAPPPVAIAVEGAYLKLHTTTNHRAPGAQTPPSKANSAAKTMLLAPLALGKWYCFVVRADWQTKLGAGALQVWMNGVQVYRAANLTSNYANELGNFPKAGIYQPGTMHLASRHLYTDFIHIGAENSTMKELYARTPCGTP